MTIIYDFNHPPDRSASESFKWQTYDPQVIPLWVADMDFPSPQPVIDALMKRVQHGVFGYPRGLNARPNELTELREVVVGNLWKEHSWRVNPDSLVFLPGVVTGLNLACQAFAGTAGGVLVQTPVYAPIHGAAHTTGCLAQEMELTRQADGAYSIDWDAFESSINSATRLFILCNPHNPVGRVFTRTELERMAEICLRRQVIIISDEIHCDLVFPGHPHLPVASLAPEIAARSITLIAPSKTYNLAGLQCSIAIIPDPELRSQFLAARHGLVPWVNLLGLVGAEAAYNHGSEWLAQVLDYLRQNRDFLFEYVQKEMPALQMARPEGTYLAWLDCRKAGISGNPYRFFLEKALVALSDGASFGKGGEGFIRLNFGCSRELLEIALGRMSQALSQLAGD